ncbi:antibiotic biosynthesis monooxygenase family protein [Roseibium sediminicola]|uniref:Antibiotic biosynthesis monooxygenase n=1 Tax=Roseibium sediminicola TaxID=2933272 RepID=A0ABT0GNB8_9HYPH|nr:antibiotic biosynthesis monooxygenase [Roseibium sp. CAU 1639]MCK7610912.1 antibiotic biosynthesis monooxygenase [Roseibium sp. CAU 1639]
MIKRIWHGWTTPENADTYCKVLLSEVIPGIEDKAIPGYLGIEVLRRDLEREVEFITIMSFRTLEDIIAFQGPDYARCYVPDVAQKVLKRWDQTSQHYDLKETRSYA